MGVNDIEITGLAVRKGQEPRGVVVAAVRVRYDADRARNGHQDGYSGDWQTVRGVSVYATAKPFRDLAAARRFAQGQAQKWGPGIAVAYLDGRKVRWGVFAIAAC